MTPPNAKSSRFKQGELLSSDSTRSEKLKDALRNQYANVKNERVPDRLKRLIDALREAEHMARRQEEQED